MDKITTLGRIFIAIALVVFGVQHFIYGAFVAGLVPAWMPGRLFWAYFVGVAFFAAAAGILYQRLARPAATLLGVMFFSFRRASAHSPDRRSFQRWQTSGPADLWRWQCAEAPGYLPAILLSRARTLGSVPQTRAIFFCHGFCGFRDSAFCLRAFRSGTGSALVSGATALGVSHRRGLRCRGRSNLSRKNGAIGGYSPGNDPFSFLSAVLHSSHRSPTAQSGPWTSGFEVLDCVEALWS